jgi:hypothetical protein
VMPGLHKESRRRSRIDRIVEEMSRLVDGGVVAGTEESDLHRADATRYTNWRSRRIFNAPSRSSSQRQ